MANGASFGKLSENKTEKRHHSHVGAINPNPTTLCELEFLKGRHLEIVVNTKRGGGARWDSMTHSPGKMIFDVE